MRPSAAAPLAPRDAPAAAPGALARLRAVLDAPVPLPMALAAALLGGALFCLWIFGTDFLLGRGAFWDFPQGVIAYGFTDILMPLTGYYGFLHDHWRFPLFDVQGINLPAGVNVAIMDCVPVVALAGRLVRELAGVEVNLYGLWVLVCFAGLAMAMVWLLRELGARSLAATIAAIVAALAMPEFLARWGHIALMGQGELVAALAFYHRLARGGSAWRQAALALLLAVATLWSALYLCAMVLPVLAAGMLQSAIARRRRWPAALAMLAGLAAGMALAMWVSGYFALEHVSGGTFGKFSMNLMAPFAPVHSALLPFGRYIVADGVGYQYEGFSYLGTGTWALALLLLATGALRLATLPGLLRRHGVLAAVLAGCTLFALSQQIWFGQILIADLPVPQSLLDLAAIFRSGARFIWPPMFVLSAAILAGTARRFPRWGGTLLLAGALLQWLDAADLRAALAANSAQPQSAPLARAAWEPAIARHDFLRAVPSGGCMTRGGPAWNTQVAVQAQLMAARRAVPTNTVLTGRPGWNCAAEATLPPLAPGEMRLYVRAFTNFDTYPPEMTTGPDCAGTAFLVLCSQRLDAAQRQALLRATHNPGR